MAEKYDAIIIGAGISGLVCGCYLSKNGMKTLIIERNNKPGGYCCSFKRNGFMFDACVHSLGGLREGGNFSRILKELNIDTRINIKKYDPSDIIVTPDYKISFWNDLDKTIGEFQKIFPEEKESIQKLFRYLSNSNILSSVSLFDKTFEDLLRQYISNDKLRAILSLPILGYGGLPSSVISAFTASKLYQEFILDGGYYPDNSIQVLPDILATRFKEFGGNLLFSQAVKEIKIKGNKAKAVALESGDIIFSEYVISNCDARQTFINFHTGDVNKQRLENMIATDSMFIAYLGIDHGLSAVLSEAGVGIWFMPHYDIDRMYKDAERRTSENISWHFIYIHPSKKSLLVITNAAFKNEDYWRANKLKVLEAIIKKAENIIPNLSEHIVFKDAATPNTLYKWTLNYNGAAYGWASTPSQIARPGLSQTTPIENLYLTGHWTTLVQGVPGVAYLGRDTAKIILRREEKNA